MARVAGLLQSLVDGGSAFWALAMHTEGSHWDTMAAVCAGTASASSDPDELFNDVGGPEEQRDHESCIPQGCQLSPSFKKPVGDCDKGNAQSVFPLSVLGPIGFVHVGWFAFVPHDFIGRTAVQWFDESV